MPPWRRPYNSASDLRQRPGGQCRPPGRLAPFAGDTLERRQLLFAFCRRLWYNRADRSRPDGRRGGVPLPRRRFGLYGRREQAVRKLVYFTLAFVAGTLLCQ